MRVTKEILQEGLTQKGWTLETTNRYSSLSAKIRDGEGNLLVFSGNSTKYSKWQMYAKEVAKPVKISRFTSLYEVPSNKLK